MIIIRLYGGLGNQMFQYAVGRQLSKTLGLPLKLDLEDFKKPHSGDTIREFELKNFTLEYSLADKNDLKKFYFPKSGLPLRIFRKLNKIAPFPLLGLVQENSFSFDSSIMKIKGTSYLDGHWQSEKYFSSIKSILQEDFQVGNLDIKNKQILKNIEEQESVSIHIRRGDYITNPAANNHHGVCSLSYYKAAISNIEKRINSPIYYLFSDDPKWAQENLKTKGQVNIIDHNQGNKSYLDMYLMKYCKHHIIANSSFSWWGAWLCQNKNQIVYAPNKWFNSSINTNDLIPENWIRL